MSIIRDLEQDILKIVKSLGYDLDKVNLIPSGRKEFGEYQLNNAFSLAKQYHQNPKVIAENILNELEKDSRFCGLNIAGAGFINLSLSDEFYIEAMNTIKQDILSNIDKQEKKRIIIDYGGANIAKTLHVGHLRSADIGEALKRLTKLLGHEVIADVHFGDIGRQSGMVIYEIKSRYPNLCYFKEDYQGEEEELPIKVEDLQEIYPLASQKAKDDEAVMEEVRTITMQIEQGHPGYSRLWEKIKELSKQDIKGIYKRLNVDFDLWEGESDCYPYIPKVISLLKEQNLLRESEGALVVDVKQETDKEPMPPLVVLKTNGGTVYQTRELATLISREERFNPDEIWYLTDNRQELYFKQVFRAAKLSGISKASTNLEFFGFGTMNGPDGKPFKTRAGGVMNLADLLDMVKQEIEKRINIDMVAEDKKEETAEKITIATIKYADFLPFRSKDFIFDVNKFSDLEGKTGPYLLYSTVRMNSLLTKANCDIENLHITKIKTQEEKEIFQLLLRMPIILENAFQEKSLNDISEYLYKLTSSYNKFYAENHILTCEDNALKESWLALTKIVYDTNILLLDTLGIMVPEKM